MKITIHNQLMSSTQIILDTDDFDTLGHVENLERITHRGMHWVRLDRVRELLTLPEVQYKDTEEVRKALEVLEGNRL